MYDRSRDKDALPDQMKDEGAYCQVRNTINEQRRRRRRDRPGAGHHRRLVRRPWPGRDDQLQAVRSAEGAAGRRGSLPARRVRAPGHVREVSTGAEFPRDLRHPVRPVAHGLSASRPRLLGADRLRAARAAGGRFVLRIEDIDATRSRPDTRRRSSRTWPGWAWTGNSRSADSPSTWPTITRPSRPCASAAWSIAASAPARSSTSAAPRMSRQTPFVGGPCPPTKRPNAWRGEAFAWRLSLAAARRRLGGFEALNFVEEGAGPDGETGVIQARPKRPATSSWPARTSASPITWPWSWTTRCRASPT
jgi:hypothetical protein